MCIYYGTGIGRSSLNIPPPGRPSFFAFILAAIKADKTNHGYNQKLLELLKVVTNDHQRLMLFEETAAPSLLQAGLRETAGLLAANLAESMNRNGHTAEGPAVQETLLRHSIRIFPECPFALRSLGYRLEQGGKELRALELYREGLARSPERLDLRLLVASSCSPFLSTAHQGDFRYRMCRRTSNNKHPQTTYSSILLTVQE